MNSCLVKVDNVQDFKSRKFFSFILYIYGTEVDWSGNGLNTCRKYKKFNFLFFFFFFENLFLSTDLFLSIFDRLFSFRKIFGIICSLTVTLWKDLSLLSCSYWWTAQPAQPSQPAQPARAAVSGAPPPGWRSRGCRGERGGSHCHQSATMGGPRIENIFVKVIFGWGLLAAMVTEVPINQGGVFVGAYR